MKNSALLGLACAISTALARQHVVFGKENTTTPLVRSRHFQARKTTDENYRLSQWTASIGTVAVNTDEGKIFHAVGGAPSDVTSIVNFFVPDNAASSNCQVRLELPLSATLVPAGAMFDVFEVNGYPVASGPWAGPGNRMGGPLGSLTANLNGDSSGPAITFPCAPYAGGWLALEFVPGPLGADVPVNIEWDDTIGGPYLLITP